MFLECALIDRARFRWDFAIRVIFVYLSSVSGFCRVDNRSWMISYMACRKVFEF